MTGAAATVTMTVAAATERGAAAREVAAVRVAAARGGVAGVPVAGSVVAVMVAAARVVAARAAVGGAVTAVRVGGSKPCSGVCSGHHYPTRTRCSGRAPPKAQSQSSPRSNSSSLNLARLSKRSCLMERS